MAICWLPVLICSQTFCTTRYLEPVRNDIFHSPGGEQILMTNGQTTPLLGVFLCQQHNQQNIPASSTQFLFFLSVNAGSFRLRVLLNTHLPRLPVACPPSCSLTSLTSYTCVTRLIFCNALRDRGVQEILYFSLHLIYLKAMMTFDKQFANQFLKYSPLLMIIL